MTREIIDLEPAVDEKTTKLRVDAITVQIKRNLHANAELYLALAREFVRIRDKKLHIAGGFTTLPAYVFKNWEVAPSSLARLLAYAATHDELKSVAGDGASVPLLQEHVFALKAISHDPTTQLKVWSTAEDVAAQDGTQVTAAIIKKAAETLAGKQSDPEPPIESSSQSQDPEIDAEAPKETKLESQYQPPEPGSIHTVSESARKKPPEIQHGTEFNPSAWEPKEPEEKAQEVEDGTPEHLIQVIIGTKHWSDIRKALTQLKKNCRSHEEDPSSHYVNMQEIDRLIDQLSSEIKCRMFGCNCPVCKNKLQIKCPRCGGVGWLPVARLGNNTDAEKAWLEKQPKVKASK